MMSYFAKINTETGEVIGHYSPDVNPGMFDAIGNPLTADLIRLTETELCQSVYGEIRYVNGAFKAYVPTITLAEAKAAKQAVISAALAELDVYIPRGLEDTWTALGVDTTKLPAIQQTRLTLKKALRAAYNTIEVATTVADVDAVVIPTS